MTNANGFARRWRWPLMGVVALLTLVIAACGTQGRPPTLGKSVEVMIRASGGDTLLGQAMLTPAHGTRVVVYMHGTLVSYDNPATPAQLRQGGCNGNVVAPLTSNAPTGGSQVVVRPDADKGADVASALDANWFVVVLQSAAADAPVISCGHPLSNRQQYFDLYQPDLVDQGIGIGNALVENTVITQVRVSLTAPAANQPAQWSIHSDGCQGNMLASGTIATGTATGSGIAFAPLDSQTWWLALALNGATGKTTCVKAG